MIAPAWISLTLLLQPAADLPAVNEPDWSTWKATDAQTHKRLASQWNVLLEARPDRKYQNESEQRAMEQKVEDAYKALQAEKTAACAAGAEVLRKAKDDYERLMTASTLASLGAEKGEAFLVWAMATASCPDIVFDPIFERAREMAGRQDARFLPAVFLILRAKEGKRFLELHSWTIPTHDCLFYVLGNYGRGVLPYLYPKLKDKDPYVRRNTAFALGFFLDEKAEPMLMELLKARDIGSGGAAFALGELRAVKALKPIISLLEAADKKTRFWAAYALYELRSRDAIPALEKAAAKEKAKETLNEMKAAIEHLKEENKEPDPQGRKLPRAELKEVLQEAEKKNGLHVDMEAIAASVTSEDFDKLEAIRRKVMAIPSDLGHKRFRMWTETMKLARSRRP